MRTIHRGWLPDDAPLDVRAERARKAYAASLVVSDAACAASVRDSQTRSAETVTAFINAGPN